MTHNSGKSAVFIHILTSVADRQSETLWESVRSPEQRVWCEVKMMTWDKGPRNAATFVRGSRTINGKLIKTDNTNGSKSEE